MVVVEFHVHDVEEVEELHVLLLILVGEVVLEGRGVQDAVEVEEFCVLVVVEQGR